MSLPLFIKNFKDHFLFLLLFAFLMNIYLAVLIYMYDPAGMGAFNDMVSLLPNRLVTLFALSTIDSSMTGFLGGLFYGLPIYVFPMIYCIVMGNRLVTKYVYDGSFACFLSTPNSRIKIITTQAIYLLLSIGLLFLSIHITGIQLSEQMYSGVLNTDIFAQMNIGAFFMTAAIAMINFFFGSIFSDTRMTMIFSAGFPVIFFMLTFLSGLSERFVSLKNFSIYSIYNGPAIGVGQADISAMITFFAGAIVLSLALSLGVFFMKRLPI
ncbi:hypothetical protein Q5O24_07765 [Eubacteriaceae bacterium ES3]|nr:hypothetical protein Q5O24_07765 [Eubacteriaceae bacterium ES3]